MCAYVYICIQSVYEGFCELKLPTCVDRLLQAYALHEHLTKKGAHKLNFLWYRVKKIHKSGITREKIYMRIRSDILILRTFMSLRNNFSYVRDTRAAPTVPERPSDLARAIILSSISVTPMTCAYARVCMYMKCVYVFMYTGVGV
jgi:hypothetical protein